MSEEPLKPISEERKQTIWRNAKRIAGEKHLTITTAVDVVIDYLPNAVVRKSSKDEDKGCETERRGLLLVGEPGLGKSIAMDFFGYLSRSTVVNACDMIRRFSTGGDKEFFLESKRLRGQAIIIDDLGAERELTSYGNASPMGEWIQERYDIWQRGGPETHIVTNLSKDAIEDRYGARVIDRIYEFCIPVGIKGDSMRTSPICDGAFKYKMCATTNAQRDARGSLI